MKSIYKFGYKIDSNHHNWAKDINKIFNIDISKISEDDVVAHDNSVIDKSIDKETKWHSKFKHLENQDSIEFNGMRILKVFPSFNRYQAYVYFVLLIEGDITNSSENQGIKSEFKKFRNHIKACVDGFVDNFKIPFKEYDFLEDIKECDKYYEVIYLKNPALIQEDKEEEQSNKMDEIKASFGSIYYKYEYTKDFYYDNDEDKYMRVLNQLYVLDTKDKENIDESIKDIVNHFHSIFIIFHRSSAFYSELKCMDSELEMITLISDKLNCIWPKERLNLLLINRFKNMELYNKTFFAVLELNSQLDSLLNRVKNRKSRLEDKYNKQYERVFHNFKDDINNDYYNKLKDNIMSPLNHRTKMIDNIEKYFQPTNAQIERLQEINDSKVNFAIQWIMSLISIVIFGWGIIIVLYENTINVDKKIDDNFLFGFKFMPTYLIVIIIVVVVLVIYLSIKYIAKNSHDLSYCVRKIISENKIDLPEISKRVDKINSKAKDKNKLYDIVCILTMFTTYLLISDSKNNYNYYDNIKIRTIIERISRDG